MKTLDRICQILFFTMGAIALFLLYNGSCESKATTVDTRNYSYEQYCDSVWANDPDYYLDVVCTTDEYQQYIETNGEWWN